MNPRCGHGEGEGEQASSDAWRSGDVVGLHWYLLGFEHWRWAPTHHSDDYDPKQMPPGVNIGCFDEPPLVRDNSGHWTRRGGTQAKEPLQAEAFWNPNLHLCPK